MSGVVDVCECALDGVSVVVGVRVWVLDIVARLKLLAIAL